MTMGASRKCGEVPGVDTSGLGWYAFIAGVLTTAALMGLASSAGGVAQQMDSTYTS
jgi:hypothetical protein